MKMLVVFRKSARLRFVGHLDLMRAMQRALRRSGLPVAFSKGFNPHLLLSFAAPLPVGMIGLREIMEVPLSEEIGEAEFQARLSDALPDALSCLCVRAVEDRRPAPMAQLFAASYRIEVLEDASPLIAAIPPLLARESVTVPRKTKRGEALCDIRPMIHALTSENGNRLSCTLSLRESASCKPELLLAALSREASLPAPPRALCFRTQLLGEGLQPLETL